MRYAIYFLPGPSTALWQFGCHWLGFDSAVRADRPQPHVAGLAPDELIEATAEPRRYGFHATLKPPFALAAGSAEAALLDAARSFAASRMSFQVPALEVRAIGRFLALVPACSSPGLSDLAAACVETFEPFRAPLTESDLARRLAKPLSPRQRGYLDAWGYPYVFDEFRFHMTLTGPLDDARRTRLHSELQSAYAAIAAPLAVDAIAVLRQPDRSSRFQLIERLAFMR